MIPAKGYAVLEANGPFQIYNFNRRALGLNDVLIHIHYCGICHTDIHQAKNDWQGGKYPMIPGHEITGKVVKVGENVKRFKENDAVGVGFLVDSCRSCEPCNKDREQYCANGYSGTFNGTEQDKETPTYGGYSNYIVVTEHFVVKIPDGLPLDSACPLMCAGITSYSPLKKYLGKNAKVAVIGLGGVGHMAVKFANALGAEVTVLSTSEEKRTDAMRLGAKHFIVSKDAEQMKSASNKFNFIFDSASADHDVIPYLQLLAFEGVFCVAGAPVKPLNIPAYILIAKCPIVTGVFVGGIKETQEMLEFAAKHKITCDIELLKASPENLATAFERTLNNDIRYRFVIDLQNAFT
ncbi:unnamed protein product [Didymodactylos carnosus]|uniref:Enoyl reductase (ER) domain-containing protein n=1 Tax=Didymodactylos carnosus TaxID=1234261 RepID=A0A813WHM9_9BILA|nr:unnamed protein product [Didymodactylos carnosus]CAF0904175.1 unnamed protein product [Didymodactylos carnosus]CAF3638495.1 unnamed protein product [Didymodactylos carnosus]CAF3684366.1 unnamed protein product [Didymodactylos carnosus]